MYYSMIFIQYYYKNSQETEFPKKIKFPKCTLKEGVIALGIAWGHSTV